MTYSMTFDLATRTGTVVVNTSMVNPRQLAACTDRVCKVFADGYAMGNRLALLGPGEINRPLPWKELTDEQRRFQATKMAIHAAMVDRMDREIGRLIEATAVAGDQQQQAIRRLTEIGTPAVNPLCNALHDSRQALRTAGARFETSEFPWRQKFMEMLTHPVLVYLLFLGGIAGIYAEFTHPGAVFPGVVGALCLLLFALSAQVLPVSAIGVLLIVLAAVAACAAALAPDGVLSFRRPVDDHAQVGQVRSR